MPRSIENVKAKLKKLYAMIDTHGNASEQEIQTAMTKARKLMAEYHLSEAEFISVDKKAEQRLFDIKFSTLVNPWINKLNSVVANNYCCHPIMESGYRMKQHRVGMIGFPTDLDISEATLKYAVDSVKAKQKELQKAMLKQGYTYKDCTAANNAYGNGFVVGIEERFKEQNKTEDESFAMVMVEPNEVKEEVSKLGSKSLNTSKAYREARKYDMYAAIGFHEGKKFSMADRLTSKN